MYIYGMYVHIHIYMGGGIASRTQDLGIGSSPSSATPHVPSQTHRKMVHVIVGKVE